jgi:very-short-patch-repair endonuclease
VCTGKKIIIESDGSQHYRSEEDLVRDAFLSGKGYTVLRFWNTGVLKNIDGVIQKILEVAHVASS